MRDRRRPPFRFARAAAALVLALAGAPVAHAASPPCGTVVLPAAIGLSPTPSGIATLHPMLMTGQFTELNAIDLLYRPLIWLDDQRHIDWNRSLARAIVPSDDDTRFTVTLRPWHWSDGSLVSSADVLYAWRLIRALGPAYYDFDVGGVPSLIRSVAAPDARTIVFTTTRTVNPDWFEQLALIQFTPLPAADWGRFSVAEQQSRQSDPSFYRLVDGPFRLRSLRLGRDAVFERNDRYDGHRPSYARLVEVFDASIDPLEALRTGMLDAVQVPFTLWHAASRLHDFRRVALGPMGQLTTLIPNLRRARDAFLRDDRVRQAIARAIDQAGIVRVAFDGQSQTQEGFLATALGALLPPELRAGGGPLAYDPAASRALLDRAGYRPGPDGVRAGHGQRLAFTLLVGAGFDTEILMAQMIEADLRRVGIAMSIRQLEINQVLARVATPGGDWDAALIEWDSGGYPDGTQWFASDSASNYAGFHDPATDRLLADATARGGDGPLYALERHVLTEQPMIFLPDGDATLLVRPGLGGIGALVGINSEFSPEYLTLEGPMTCDAAHA